MNIFIRNAVHARLLLFISLTLLYYPLAAQQSGEWYHLASTGDTPKLRSDGAFVKVGDAAYLLGGYGTTPIQRYDPNSRKWETTKSTLNNIHHFQAREYGGKIYILGALSGHYPSEFVYKNVLVYDPQKDKVYEVGEMPTGRQRGSGGVVVYKDQLYLIGGNPNGHAAGAVAWVDRYNPASGKWTELPDAPHARDHFTAEIIGDRIYVAGGGRSSLGTSLGLYAEVEPAVDVFDLSLNEWIRDAGGPDALPATGSGTSTAVLDHYLLVMGGITGNNNRAHSTTSMLDTKTGKWSSLKEMIQGRHATQAAVFGDRVYVAAGSAGGMNARIEDDLPFVEYFSLQPQPYNRYEDWAVIGSANYRRAEGQMISHRGEFYFFNGFDNDLQLQQYNEKYNPATNRWTKIASQPLSSVAATHTAAALVGDVVWLVGGRIGSHPGRVTDEVWLYDISEDKWTQGPRMPVRIGAGGLAHIGHKLHHVGGFDENAGCDVDDHWVYDLENPEAGWQDYSKKSSMPMARNHFGTVVLGGKLYAIGGQHGHDDCDKGKNLKLVHVYDPQTDKWKRLKDLPEVQSHTEPSTFSYNKKLYSLGGQGANAREVWEYNPEKDEWITLDDLELPLRLIAPGARVFGGNLFAMVGGEVAVNSPRTEVRATYFGPNVTQELAFVPAKWQPGKKQGMDVKPLLVNYSAEDETDYVIDLTSKPAWLQVSNPRGKARESFAQISLSVDTMQLPAGTYQHTLTATAPGYKPAKLEISFTVGKKATVPDEDEEDEEEEDDDEPIPSDPASETYWLEAECANVGGAWLRKSAGEASNGSYVTPTPGLDARVEPPRDLSRSTITFNQVLNRGGDYHLYARVLTPDPSGDSFWLRINGGDWIKWDYQLITGDNFAWKEAPGSPFTLPSGALTVEFAYREAGIFLDKLSLSNGKVEPSGKGGEANACAAAPPTPEKCGGTDCATEFWVEAECHEAVPTWKFAPVVVGSSNHYTSAGGFSDFDGEELDRVEDQLQYVTNELAEGKYYLYLHLNAPDNSSNSFWVRIDDGNWIKFWKETTGLNMLTNGFEWRRVNDDQRLVSFDLSAGRHLIAIAKREINTQLDRLVLSQDSVLPSGSGPAISPCNPQTGLDFGTLDGPMTTLPPTGGGMLEIFPNPAAEEVLFRLGEGSQELITVIIRDQSGRRVITKNYVPENGIHADRINVADLPTGIYNLHAVVTSGHYVKTFVKK